MLRPLPSRDTTLAGVGGNLKNEQHAKVQIELVSPITEEVKKLMERVAKTAAGNP